MMNSLNRKIGSLGDQTDKDGKLPLLPLNRLPTLATVHEDLNNYRIQKNKDQNRIIDKIIEKHDDIDWAASIANNFIPVDGTVEHQITPQLRNDWQNIIDIYVNFVASAFRMPRDVIYADNYARTNILQSGQLNSTIRFWKYQMSRTFEKLYSLLFNDKKLGFYMSHFEQMLYKDLKDRYEDGILNEKEFKTLAKAPFNL